jgi:polysaccharide chain length determinant protein (PEP-CTERM system associated)
MDAVIATALAYLRAVWRRRWLAMLCAWIFCLAVWGITLSLPDRYEASAKVYVDASTALKPVLEGLAVGDNPESELSLVREALLSRPQLEAVARKTNLDAKVMSPVQMDALILDLQTKIAVTSSMIRGGEGGPDNLYVISYQHRNRAKSIEVVKTLLDSFVNDTLRGNRSGADEAQTFLRNQISDYEKRLADAEARLADFKKRNVGMIPGERGDYFTRLDAEIAGLQKTETDLAVASSRREALRNQLEASQRYIPGIGNANPMPAQGMPASDLSVRIQESEARLEGLLLRYTDKHPEVIALRATITDLKAREAKELADLAKGGSGTGAIRSLTANPVYQAIQMQLNQVEVDIASLGGAVSQHRQQIAELRRFVDLAPEVEQEFARLNRDYGVTKVQYEALVKRLEEARISDDAARSGVMRFEIIDPPRANVKPVWPNRPLFVSLGLFGGCLVGIAVALVLQLLSPTFSDARLLSQRTGLPVLGAISRVPVAAELARMTRDRRWIVFASVVLFGACAVLVVFGNTGARLLRQLVA